MREQLTGRERQIYSEHESWPGNNTAANERTRRVAAPLNRNGMFLQPGNSYSTPEYEVDLRHPCANLLLATTTVEGRK